MGKLSTLQPRLACLSTDIAAPLPAALRRADPARAGTTARGYGWQWQQLRLTILRRDLYQCQACKLAGRITPARDVDHVINKAAGGTDDPGNLQALCKPCHDEKTERETIG
mgnify:CR=1 FL=1